jgi:hypothetical protein
MSGVGFSFRPSFEGQIVTDQVTDDLFDRLERRLDDGLFVSGRRNRAHYRVTNRSPETLEFEAEDFFTAYAIGLNHVTLRRTGRDTISYQVSFARWSRYAVIHGALLGLAFVIADMVPPLRHEIESYPIGSTLFWGMVLFWSVAWPWLLTAFHRPFAARALERILREELRGEPRVRAAS